MSSRVAGLMRAEVSGAAPSSSPQTLSSCVGSKGNRPVFLKPPAALLVRNAYLAAATMMGAIQSSPTFPTDAILASCDLVDACAPSEKAFM